jgi:hypothetical protein
MKRYYTLVVFIIAFFAGPGLYGLELDNHKYQDINELRQDTIIENQILYNGRIWINQYAKVLQDQFLFSDEFLPGSLTISGKTFNNIEVRYDILNDEIIIPTNHGSYLQVNKEMVDSFTIIFKNRTYHFINFRVDEGKGFKGYINVLYEGITPLYVKLQKKILLLVVDGKFDEFYQYHRIYIVKDSLVQLISSKRELLSLLNVYKNQIRSYIKKNRLVVKTKYPESIVPVIEYYDTLLQ